MIDPAYAILMARYNEWQNRSLYDAASTLSDEDRRRDLGAFFHTIHGTLGHILWADRMWHARFTAAPLPKMTMEGALSLDTPWEDLRAARRAQDAMITNWAGTLTKELLSGDLTYWSVSANKEFTKPWALLVVHLFNHQTHHRGQVHAMLTRLGAKPDDTDLPFLASA